MKKVLVIIALVLIIALIAIVSVNMKDDIGFSLSQDEDIKVQEDIEFYISEANNKTLKFVIENNSSKSIVYGADYEIQKSIDGLWNKYNLVIDFIEIAYMLDSGKTAEEEIVFATVYGNLGKGKYRLIKYINNQRMSAEFEIK